MHSAEPLETLTTGDIHVWFTNVRDADAKKQRRWLELLSEDEKSRMDRYRFAHDREVYLATRATVRTTLARYAAVKPADWRFATNGFGKPHIEGPQTHSDLRFSVSHTGSLVALAVTRGRAVGIDIEEVHEGDWNALAERNFAAPEAEAVRQASVHEAAPRFFEIWTLKESYLKALGKGLSVPLDSFSFTVEATIRLTPSSAPGDSRRWAFHQWRTASGQIVALCAERCSECADRLVVRNTFAGGAESACAPAR